MQIHDEIDYDLHLDINFDKRNELQSGCRYTYMYSTNVVGTLNG